MGKILFITGTDTGVGKTSTAVLLVRQLVAQGHAVRVMKPVESGCEPDADGNLFPADASMLWQVSGKKQSLDEVCPYRFRAGVSPHVAARVEGRRIDCSSLAAAIRAQAELAEILVVEGAGGLLVPLDGVYTFADLAKDVNATCLVVVASRLGALNHAALTFEVLRKRKIPIAGYVLNLIRPPEKSIEVSAETTNRESLVTIAGDYGIEELGEIPFRVGSVGDREESGAQGDDLSAAVLRHL